MSGWHYQIKLMNAADLNSNFPAQYEESSGDDVSGMLPSDDEDRISDDLEYDVYGWDPISDGEKVWSEFQSFFFVRASKPRPRWHMLDVHLPFPCTLYFLNLVAFSISIARCVHIVHAEFASNAGTKRIRIPGAYDVMLGHGIPLKFNRIKRTKAY